MLNQLTSLEKSIEAKKENSLFCIYEPLGVKIFTRFRLQLSHLNNHKF